MNYVQLRFWKPSSRSYAGAPVLNVNESPIVTKDGGTLKFPDPDSRDMICRFIGELVLDVRIEEEKEIGLVFHSGGVIQIPLDGLMAEAGLESAVFYADDDGSVCEAW